ncbi:MAG TPA: NAD(+)/NADH kinase [Gemmatimonadaceae bacterium]|nr:NAD(+)/NADH kinase [Gemmatimonadaceae bacterium]
MIRLGVVGHKGYDGLADIVRCVFRLAPELGLEPIFEPDLLDVAPGCGRLEAKTEIDALLTLGGDGTLLRGARLLAGRPVPILGINLGRLGFLTSCGRDETELALRRLAAGDYLAERRMQLEARSLDGAGGVRKRWFALNDVVLHKGGFARVLHLSVSADGDPVGTYAADGIVFSTPTGSTAYSLSAGGPVVMPTLESILLTPISAHTLAIRPLVLAADVELRVQADDGPEELLVTVDGQVGTTFAVGETLLVRRADRYALIVRFPGSSFFSVLTRKLGWSGLADREGKG